MKQLTGSGRLQNKRTCKAVTRPKGLVTLCIAYIEVAEFSAPYGCYA